MLSDAFLNRLDTLRLSMKNPANGGAGGIRHSRSLGASAEFSDFREYTPGDDIRRLDWNAYARFDRLFMKLFMEEQESVVTIIVDGSASMEAKRDNALKAAAAIGYLALSGGDRLRIAWISEEGAILSPFLSGRRAYPQMSDFLSRQSMRGQTMLLSGVRRIDPFPKGMSFVISDGYLEDGLNRLLDLLRYKRQEAAFIHVLSSFEMKPDLEGPVKLQDAEGAPDLDILANGATLKLYQTALKAFLKDTCECCHKRGAPYMLLCDDAPFEETFLSAMACSGIIAS